MTANTPEPPPVTNDSPPVWPMVIDDVIRYGLRPELVGLMEERDRIGREKYGTPLQPFNGRDPIVDALQEALDLAVYLRQALHESGEDITRSTGNVATAYRLALHTASVIMGEVGKAGAE